MNSIQPRCAKRAGVFFTRLVPKQALCSFRQFLAATCLVNAHRCAASARSPQLRLAQKLLKIYFALFGNKSISYLIYHPLFIVSHFFVCHGVYSFKPKYINELNPDFLSALILSFNSSG